nr:N-acetyltransferase [Desulfobulbaceae bacterium]
MIRNARMSDVKAIYDLLAYFAKQELLLGRSLSSLYDQLRDFKVYTVLDNGEMGGGQGKEILAGAAALHVCWENLAEVRSLVVASQFQGTGIGAALVNSCLDEAETLGITRIFTLTYQAGFFNKFGFKPIDKNELPHKIWSDCLQCPKFPDCNEEALIWEN